jgi:hypothetical protein
VEKRWHGAAALGVAAVLGLTVKFLYTCWPNPVTAILAPVDGSAWEQGKLLFWPGIAAALVHTRLAGGGGSRSGRCAALLLMPLAMTLLCWALPAVPVALWWAASLLTGAAAYGLALRRLWGAELLWYTLAILLAIAYLLFTVLPPLGGPFTDPADVSALAPIPF